MDNKPKEAQEQTLHRKLPTNYLETRSIPSSINEEARTVELTWTTGHKGLRSGWSGQFYEELEVSDSAVNMSRLNGAPLLASHDSSSLDSVIGVVESSRLVGNEGKAIVRFSKDPEAEKVFNKIKEGVLRNVSVGYSVQKYVRVSPEEAKIPTFRAVQWTPMEISIVPIGFDPKANVRNSEKINHSEHDVEVIIRDNKQTNEVIGMSKENNQPQQSPVVDVEAIRQEAVKAEKERCSDILTAVRAAGLEESFAQELIDSNISSSDAGKRVFAKMVELKNQPKIDNTIKVEVIVDETDKKRAGIEEALLHRANKNQFKLSPGNHFHGQSLLRTMEGLVHRPAGMSDAQYAIRVMSSSDFPYILANLAEKTLQNQYQLQPRTWQRWASSETLRDFKLNYKNRSGEYPSMSEVLENGEYKRMSFSEERESVQLKSFGNILPFSRRMLINDDLGAITRTTSQFASSVSRKENSLVYGILTANAAMGDGVTLFHSSHANLGTGAAISDTTIGEAFQLMKTQTGVDGLDPLNLSPRYMICGPQSEVIARKYLAVITPAQATNVNVFSNSLELVVDAEISSNDYFFAADQNLISTVVLVRLEGQEQPRVESRVNFDNDALEIKLAHDCNAYAADWRGLVKNANAS